VTVSVAPDTEKSYAQRASLELKEMEEMDTWRRMGRRRALQRGKPVKVLFRFIGLMSLATLFTKARWGKAGYAWFGHCFARIDRA
jgi:hypothetical protein